MVLTESNHATTPGGGARTKTPLKSPRPTGLMSPNNDDKERAEARQARAAAEKRRSISFEAEEAPASQTVRASQGLGHGQIVELYSNCIKLASENKINAKNSWSLQLIDHISDLVKPSKDEETNFQKASCTLDAGVKIYSYRVDSVYTETFKVLGGVNRSSGQDEEAANGDRGEFGEGEEGEEGEEGAQKKKKAYNPSSTLESSLEALNIKKSENSITVDPLFHKTSAQFDEGGARGLLLNNLSVFNGCELMFDSLEVPGAGDRAGAGSAAAMVDVSAIREQLTEAATAAAHMRISPSVDEIRALMGDRAVASDCTDDVAEAAASAPAYSPAAGDGGDAGGYFGGGGGGGFDDDDDDAAMDYGGAADDDFDDGDGGGGYGGGGATAAEGLGQGQGGVGVLMGVDALEWMASAASQAGGAPRAWAGASHWRYNKPKLSGTEEEGGSDDSAPKAKAPRAKAALIDFESDAKLPNFAFAVGKAKEINLVSQPSTSDTLLPADLHYQPTELASLFLRPRSACVRRGQGGGVSTSGMGFEDGGGFGGEDDFGGGYGGDDGDSDIGDAAEAWDGGAAGVEGDDDDDLVAAPRQVEKISVNYARASKQVDVKILKETLWSGLHAVDGGAEEDEGPASFQELVSAVPEDCPAGRPEDVSVHLCFICLLHLANEHGLAITGVESMDELDINGLPAAATA